MDCPLLRFKNGFIDVTVQKLQREQPLEVWSTISREPGIFVTRNVLGGGRRRRKVWRPHDRRSSIVQKRRHKSSQSGTRHPQVHCVANLLLRTEETALSHPGAVPWSWTWGLCGMHGHVPWLKGLSSVSIRALLTVLNYRISSDPLYVRFQINFLLWIYSPLY